MVLLAVYKVVLHRYSSQTDILVGSPMACRTTPELNNLVGQLANPVVLRSRVTSDMTFE